MKDAYRGRARSTDRVARHGVLAAAIAFSIPSLLMSSTLMSSAAMAEVHDPLRGYAMDGTPVAGGPPPPRAHDNPVADGADSAPRGPVYLSFNRIRRIAARQGLRVVSLRRRGRAFSATAMNDAGHTIEVTFNAFNGAIIDQKDVSGAVAAAPSQSASPTSASAAVAVAPTTAEATPGADALAAARAAAATAVAAEAEAKQLAATRATEARLAQSKLAAAEAAAQKAAQIKAAEDRRAQRNDAKVAEARRRMLAGAESRLAQAKAAQARIEADVKQAEAKAAEARAALAPAEMTKTSDTPAAMKPVAAPTPAPVVAVKTPESSAPAAPAKGVEAPAPVDSVKTPEPGAPSEAAKDDKKKSEASQPSATPTAAADDGKNGEAKPADTAKSQADTAGADKPKIETGDIDKVSESKSGMAASTGSPTDMAPTGSTIQSPPEPYYAPTPDEAAAAVEKH